MEDLNTAQLVVILVCSLGVGLMMVRLFSADRCTFGGFHDWEVERDYQYCTIQKCKKCKETKCKDKLND